MYNRQFTNYAEYDMINIRYVDSGSAYLLSMSMSSPISDDNVDLGLHEKYHYNYMYKLHNLTISR